MHLSLLFSLSLSLSPSLEHLFCHGHCLILGHCEIDVSVLVDRSRTIDSIGETGANSNWLAVESTLSQIHLLVHQNAPMGTSSRMALRVFNSERVTTLMSLTDSLGYTAGQRKINIELLKTPFSASSENRRILQAVREAVNELERNVRDVGAGLKASQCIILFTDALQFNNAQRTLEILKAQMDKKVYVLAIGKF